MNAPLPAGPRVNWPDFTLPPINLWNVPWQRIQERPSSPTQGATDRQAWLSAKQAQLQGLLQAPH